MMRAHMNRVIQTFALWKTKAQISCTNVQADQALVTRSLDTLYTVSFNSDISRVYPTKNNGKYARFRIDEYTKSVQSDWLSILLTISVVIYTVQSLPNSYQ